MSHVPQEASRCIQRCRASRDNEHDLSEALHHLVAYLHRVYLVIDGLDEWLSRNGHRDNLLKWITRMKGWGFPHLHVLLTSQHTPDIYEEFKDLKSCPLDSNSDIHKYIRHQLQADPKLAKFGNSLRYEIEKSLISGTDGV